MNKSTLISKLPPPKGIEQVIAPRQNLDDIMREVLNAHAKFAGDYDRICGEFAGGSTEKKLYDFCRSNLVYNVEDEKDQTTKSPAVLLEDGHCDCKGYAGFIAGVLDALNRDGKGRYNFCYRFAEYPSVDDDDPGHVFVVVRQRDSSEIWIDPVMSQFNKRNPAPENWVDKTPPDMLTRLSGIQSTGRPVPAAGSAGRRPGAAGCCAGPLSGYQVGAALVPSFTPMQQGIPVMQAVFNWRNEYPGAAAVLASNPPVRFFDGPNQIALPPPVTYGGQPTPPLPQGINLVWDSSFMGRPIPADMINIANLNGALVLSPTKINSLGLNPLLTYNYLTNTNRYLLFLLVAALENLIYSYSSWPWGNQYQDLATQIQTVVSGFPGSNNYNFLIYPKLGEKTFGGQILQGTAQVVKVALPVASIAANFIVPGSGVFVAAAGAALTSAEAASNKNQQVNTTVNTPEVFAPSAGLSLPGVSLSNLTTAASTFAQQNPLTTFGIAAAVGFLLYEMFKD